MKRLIDRLEVRASELRRIPEGVSRIMPSDDYEWSPHAFAALFEEARERIEELEATDERGTSRNVPRTPKQKKRAAR